MPSHVNVVEEEHHAGEGGGKGGAFTRLTKRGKKEAGMWRSSRAKNYTSHTHTHTAAGSLIVRTYVNS